MVEKILNVHQRLAAAMGEVDYIQKEQKKGMNYTIVSHDAVTAKVRPVLLSKGIVYYPVRCDHTQDGNRSECSMTVRFVNIDDPTDFFDVPTFGYGIDSQDKGPGKAMSYAVKYALLKALGLETGDDPDNESIPHEKPAEKQQDAPRNEDARKLFTTLNKDLRLCKHSDDVKRWWKDPECVSLRDKLPVSWQDNLKKEMQEFGASLKEAEAEKSFIDDLPGDKITNTQGREVHNLEAGE